MSIGSWIQRLCLAASAIALAAGAAPSYAQNTSQTLQNGPRISTAIDASQRKVLGGTVHPLATAANDRGRTDGALAMKDMILLLQPSDSQSAALKQTVAALHNPNSPSFHKWLTPAQYAAQFGLGDQDMKTVIAWLTSSGFTVEKTAQAKNWVRFSGTAAQVESAFKTSIHSYSVQGHTRYANATAISIPTALAPVVAGVVRLNNFVSDAQHIAPGKIERDKSGKLMRSNASGTAQVSAAETKAGKPSPQLTVGSAQTETFLTPGDFAKIYDSESTVAGGNDGSGVSIAIVGRSDIELSDVEAFRTLFGLPFNDPTITYVSDDPGDVSGDDVEGTLDVEWAGAVAPRANINFVIGASTSSTDGVDLSASYIVDNALAPIMSLSFGLCEAFMSDTQIAFYNQLWEQAAAEGITVLVSTGDSGASGCNNPGSPSTVYGFGVNGLASTPYDTAVGGTEFNETDLSTYWNLNNGKDQSSVKGYIPEAVWNESCTEGIPYSQTNCNYAPYTDYSYAGSGGASSCVSRTTDADGTEFCAAGYPKPSWQSAPGVPKDGARDIPDVSLAAAAAHDAYTFCFQGGCQWTTNSDGTFSIQDANIIGGTSAAAPSMAGVVALIEQKHGAYQGVINYELYSMASQKDASCDSSSRKSPTQASSCVFNDVTSGSNATGCFSGDQDCQGQDQPVQVGLQLPFAVFPPDSQLDGHSAVSGYDLATGLGSVDVANLLAAWGTHSTADSATSLKLSKTTFAHGTPVALSGAVTPASGSGTPTGDVLLETGAKSSVLSTPLSSGAYNTTSIDLPGGSYSLTARYSGDSTYGSSSSQPVAVTVTPENSTLTGITWAYSRFYILGRRPILQLGSTDLGNSFWVQFNVAGLSGSTAATGTIKLSVGGKSVGSYPVTNTGEIYVQCGPETTCDLAPGSYTFQANYSGDSSFNASSGSVTFTVNKGKAYSQASVSIAQPIANTPDTAFVSFKADPTLPPTGTVTLRRDDTNAVLGTATIDKTGVATIPFTAAAGDYHLIPSYSGDNNYTDGGVSSYPEIITLSNSGTAPAKVNLNLSGSSFSLGQRSPITVTVTPTSTAKGTATPIGYVVLYNQYGAISSQLLLSGGKAVGTVEWDNVGAQNVYATYWGDENYAGAHTANTAVTVAKGALAVVLQPTATIVAVGGQTSVSALLTNPNPAATGEPAPTGAVQFYDSLNGAAPVAIGTAQGVTAGNQGTLLATQAMTLAQGSHVITAAYSGDTNWAAVTSAPSPAIVATTPSFTDAPTAPSLTITAGQTASLGITTQSILGFSGPIALGCGGTLPEGVICSSTTVAPNATGSITLTSVAPGESSATGSSQTASNPLLAGAGTVAMAGVLFLVLPNRRRFHHLAIVLTAIGLAGFIGCGGSSVKPTTLVLSSSNTKVASGSGVTFTATIQTRNNATGTVTFYDGSTAIGSPAQVTNGVATLNTTSLAVGTHPITAKYSGDHDDSASSSSNTLEQSITGSFTLTIDATSGSISQPLTIPATLN